MWRQAVFGNKRLSNPIYILSEYVAREWRATLKLQRRLNGSFVEAGDFYVEYSDVRLLTHDSGAVTPGALVVIARVLERRGYYTRAQAVAPTKIWHQVVVYPVLGYWLWTAVIGGLSAPGGTAAWSVWAGKALLVALTGIWAATNVYDRRHPKLGHPPFDWRRVRPRPRVGLHHAKAHASLMVGGSFGAEAL